MTLRQKLFEVVLEYNKETEIPFEAFAENIISICKQEIEDAKPKWISVKDRLPELDISVLCYSIAKDIDGGEKGRIISMGKRLINYTQQPVFVADAGMFYEVEEILFWMPLPESPKENSVCHYCGGAGYRAIPNHYTDEPEQIQCEFCNNLSPKESV